MSDSRSLLPPASPQQAAMPSRLSGCQGRAIFMTLLISHWLPSTQARCSSLFCFAHFPTN